MKDSFEDKLLVFSRETFNSKSNQLDDEILQKLRQARKNAIASTKQNKSTGVIFPTWLAPVSSVTVFASVSLIAVSLIFQPDLLSAIYPSPFDDVSLLSSSDSLDFYENIDFYIWLEAQDNAS